MAAAAIKEQAQHLIPHGLRRSQNDNDDEMANNSPSQAQQQQQPTPPHSQDEGKQSAHDGQDRDSQQRVLEEKNTISHWEDHKRPLSPSQVERNPKSKMVGHSSKMLRCEDFELIKTLGTGTRRHGTKGRERG